MGGITINRMAEALSKYRSISGVENIGSRQKLFAAEAALNVYADELRPLFVARLGPEVTVKPEWFDYENEVRLLVEVPPIYEGYRIEALEQDSLDYGDSAQVSRWVDAVCNRIERKLSDTMTAGTAACAALLKINAHRAPGAKVT